MEYWSRVEHFGVGFLIYQSIGNYLDVSGHCFVRLFWCLIIKVTRT